MKKFLICIFLTGCSIDGVGSGIPNIDAQDQQKPSAAKKGPATIFVVNTNAVPVAIADAGAYDTIPQQPDTLPTTPDSIPYQDTMQYAKDGSPSVPDTGKAQAPDSTGYSPDLIAVVPDAMPTVDSTPRQVPDAQQPDTMKLDTTTDTTPDTTKLDTTPTPDVLVITDLSPRPDTVYTKLDTQMPKTDTQPIADAEWTVYVAYWCGLLGEELLDSAGAPIPCTYNKAKSATNPSGPLTDCLVYANLGYPMQSDSCYIYQEKDGSLVYRARFLAPPTN